MYRFDVTVQNPMLGESRLLRYQFDPATFDQAAWDKAFAAVLSAVDSLLASEAAPVNSALVPVKL